MTVQNLTNPFTGPVFRWFVPAQNGTGLVPACGYKVTFYAAGTANALAVYTDPALQVPYPSPANVVTLNSQGYAVIYLGLSAYKIVISDPLGSPVFTLDNILGGNQFGTGFAASVADLRTINTNLNQFTYLAGYYAPGDGGEGFFYNQTSVTPDDGGYSIQSTFDPSRVWFRIPDENGDIRAASFGYIPANVGDQTSNLANADAYATSKFARLSIEAGGLSRLVSMTLNSPYVKLQPNFTFNAETALVLTFVGILEAPPTQVFGGNVTAVLSPSQIAIPEWFGAIIEAPDNTAAFTALWASGAGGFKINPGTWTVTATTPPTNKRILSFGIVTDGVNTIIPVGEYYFSAEHVVVLGNTRTDGTISSGGSITTDAGSDITSGEDVNAFRDVEANRNVISGATGTGGYVQAQAGTGIGTFKAAGKILGGAVNARIDGSNHAILILPANSITSLNDAIFIEAAGTVSAPTGSGYTFTITTTTGAFLSIALVATAMLTRWSISCKAIWNGTAMIVSGILNTNCASGLTSTVFCSSEAFDNTLTQNFTLNATTPGPQVDALQYTIGIIPS